MSTQARRQQPPSSQEHEGPSSEGTLAPTPPPEELPALFEEALKADGSWRGVRVGTLNAFIERMARSEDPARLAPVLQGLLARDGVDTLVDEQGTTVGIAITRALLSMAYPHPLEVPPERLEALRQWDGPMPPPPSFAMGLVLVAAALVQLVLYMFLDSGHRLFADLTADMLSGLHPPPPTGWVENTEELIRRSWLFVRPAVPWVQNVGALLAFFFATTIAETPRERRLARRMFFALGWLGLVVGAYFPLNEDRSRATVVGAVGALIAGSMLRLPKKDETDKPPKA